MVLVVFHVCVCALMWKLSLLKDTDSKSSPVLRLLFVKNARDTRFGFGSANSTAADIALLVKLANNRKTFRCSVFRAAGAEARWERASKSTYWGGGFADRNDVDDDEENGFGQASREETRLMYSGVRRRYSCDCCSLSAVCTAIDFGLPLLVSSALLLYRAILCLERILERNRAIFFT